MQLNIVFAILGLCAAVQETSTSRKANSGLLSRAAATRVSQATAFSELEQTAPTEVIQQEQRVSTSFCLLFITSLIHFFQASFIFRFNFSKHLSPSLEQLIGGSLGLCLSFLNSIAFVVALILGAKVSEDGQMLLLATFHLVFAIISFCITVYVVRQAANSQEPTHRYSDDSEDSEDLEKLTVVKSIDLLSGFAVITAIFIVIEVVCSLVC
jgi:F0F1-type ATP synthase assembly protein I